MKMLRVGSIALVLTAVLAFAGFAADLGEGLQVEVTEEICAAFGEYEISEECIAKVSADMTAKERLAWSRLMDDAESRAAINGLIIDTLAQELSEEVESAYMVVAGRVWQVELPD